MLNDFEFWTLTAIGAIAFVLSGTNMVLAQTNGKLQAEASSRAQDIQQGVAVANLYRDVIQALADRAIKTQDEQIRDLLAAEGLNVTFPPAAPAQGRKP